MLDVASPQHGVAGREQLIESGISPGRVDGSRRAGRLLPVFTGVYAVGRELETAQAAWKAATIAAGKGAVLMGRSAGEAWGMLDRRPGLPCRIEVARSGESAVMPGRSSAMRGSRLHIRQRVLRECEVGELGGIPVTSPVRTQIDLVAGLGPKPMRRAFIEACRLHLVERGDLPMLVRRSRGRPGAAFMRELVGLWVPGLDRIKSVLEGMFLLGWCASDRRIPEVNVKVGRWEVDFLWRQERLVVETDGHAFHDHEIARGRDARKDAWLRSQGLTVLRFSYRDVDQEMKRVCETTRACLDSAPEQRSNPDF